MDTLHIITIIIATLTVFFAAVVAFARNIIYSAYALLGVFAGIFGLYLTLSADFVAVIQLVVYIGGIMVLILFAVMLTTKIGERKGSNPAMGRISAITMVGALGFVIYRYLMARDQFQYEIRSELPTTSAIGDLLLNRYVLPFEWSSILLVLALIGAVVLARREVR